MFSRNLFLPCVLEQWQNLQCTKFLPMQYSLIKGTKTFCGLEESCSKWAGGFVREESLRGRVPSGGNLSKEEETSLRIGGGGVPSEGSLPKGVGSSFGKGLLNRDGGSFGKGSLKRGEEVPSGGDH